MRHIAAIWRPRPVNFRMIPLLPTYDVSQGVKPICQLVGSLNAMAIEALLDGKLSHHAKVLVLENVAVIHVRKVCGGHMIEAHQKDGGLL